ncbi:MAG: NAD(P)H-dependent oxidoreductase [Chloroflexota bacterium]
MKVVGIVGSPRVGGNTDILVSEALAGAAEAGAQVDKVLLNKLRITPCQACEACRKTGRCRVEDDMQPLYDQMLSADALVLGTPIYFWGVSAQLKAFVDRWFALAQPGVQERLANKRVLLICAFADEDLHTPDAAILGMRTAVEYMGMRFLEPVRGVAWARGEIKDKPETLAQARASGRLLVG